MSNIDRISFTSAYNNANLYTKRTCLDNSEMYITAKLNMLYKKTIANATKYKNARYLRKMVEGNHLDESV